MPFVEPAINTYDVECPSRLAPDLSRCDPEETLALCKVWDAKNLLRLFHVDEAPASKKKYVKVFNNYKGPLADRQIGDRRGANYSEGVLVGVSQRLPTGCALLQIMPVPFKETLKGSITDRRDFYHQVGVTRERCLTNLVYPPMPLASFEGLHAHGAFLEEAAGRMKQGREIIGDYLHQKPKPILVDDSTYVVAGFSALFQGDHLGVEVATLAHSNLLIDAGLLDKRHRLQGGIPLREDQWAEGLVIDDYFVISKELVETSGPSVSATKLGAAKACYQKEGIMGSDDKDVVSAAVFKVCGVEIDSREEMVKKGAITADAPAEKRFALALLAARSAALPYTSDALHSCLLGSLVSVSLMRRHVLAILNEMFHVIPSVELAPGNPMLRPMSRRAADELALMSFLLPIAVSNLAASMSEEIFATDASLAKGAVVSTVVNKTLATALWRSADQRVRGVPMMRAAEAVAAWADPMFEPGPREYADEPSSREIGDPYGEGTGDERRSQDLWGCGSNFLRFVEELESLLVRSSSLELWQDQFLTCHSVPNMTWSTTMSSCGSST